MLYYAAVAHDITQLIPLRSHPLSSMPSCTSELSHCLQLHVALFVFDNKLQIFLEYFAVAVGRKVGPTVYIFYCTLQLILLNKNERSWVVLQSVFGFHAIFFNNIKFEGFFSTVLGCPSALALVLFITLPCALDLALCLSASHPELSAWHAGECRECFVGDQRVSWPI